MTSPVLRVIGFAILCSLIIILTACGGGSQEDQQTQSTPEQLHILGLTQTHSGQSSIQPINCSTGVCK